MSGISQSDARIIASKRSLRYAKFAFCLSSLMRARPCLRAWNYVAWKLLDEGRASWKRSDRRIIIDSDEIRAWHAILRGSAWFSRNNAAIVPRLILLELRNGTNPDNYHEYGSTVGREINQLYSLTNGRSSQVIDNDPPLNAHVHEITRCATPRCAPIKRLDHVTARITRVPRVLDSLDVRYSDSRLHLRCRTKESIVLDQTKIALIS